MSPYLFLLFAILFAAYYPMYLVLFAGQSARPAAHKHILIITNITLGSLLIFILFQPLPNLIKILFLTWKILFLGYTRLIWDRLYPNLKPFIVTTFIGTACYVIMFNIWCPQQWTYLFGSIILSCIAIDAHWRFINH